MNAMSLARWLLKPAHAKPALAGALVALLAAELLLPEAGLPPAREATVIAAGAPDADADAAIGQWGDTILARPLFNADRRPADDPSVAAAFTLPRLSAIIVIGGRSRAIFAAPGQKPLLVPEGGAIGPDRITAITPGKVELLGPDGAVTLHLQPMPAAPAAASNPNS